MASSLTFPVTAPSTPKPVGEEWLLDIQRNEIINEFQLKRRIVDWSSPKWVAVVRFPMMARADHSNWKGFILGLRGKLGTFTWGPSAGGISSGPMASDGGTPLVNDPGAAVAIGDTTLAIDGFDAGAVTDFALAGDWFAVGGYLYQLTENSNKDAGGAVTFTFQPPLKSAPADNAAVTVTNPKGTFRIADDEPPLGHAENHIAAGITLNIEEDI